MKFFFIIVFFTFSSQAQKDFSVNLYVENDSRTVGGPGTDRSYTSGLRASYIYAENKIPPWARLATKNPAFNRFLDKAAFNFGLGVGQQMYTPEDLKRTDLITNDRPYAGWLYVGAVANARTENFLDSIELDVGVVGPEALGEQTQREVHRALHVDLPLGWRNQLGTEPGLVLSFHRRMKFYEYFLKPSKVFDVIPYGGISLGNVLTSANVGGIARLGYNLPKDFGPTRPSGADGDPFIEVPPTEEIKHGPFWGVNVFIGTRGSYVLRNIFLDGNSFKNSHRITKRPFVSEFEGGIFARVGHVSVTWRQVTRSPEFYESQRYSTFSSITLVVSGWY